MDQVTANVAELTGHVNSLANVAKAVAAGPVGKAGALAYGVRRAVSLRRQGDAAPPARRPEIEAAPVAAGAAAQVRRVVVAWTIGRVTR
jgi:hypothetical protein